jgi:putative membrane protein
MAELRLDTAGAEGSVRLAFLPLAEAVRLRSELLDRADVGERGEPPQPERDVTLFRVEPLRLAVSLCLRTGFLVSVASAALLVAFSLGTGEPLQLALLFAALSGVASFWLRQLLVWGRFEIDETVQGLRVRSGLLSLRSQTVPLGRVQGVVVVEPLLWRLLGWARLDVTVAGVGGSDDDLEQQVESALMPVADRDEVNRLVQRLLGVAPVAVPLVAAPRRAWWLSPVGQRLLGVGVHHDVVITRRGVLTTRTDVVPRRKIQSVRLLQGPLQRRLGLATTKINLPSGPVAALAPHRDQAEAWWLLQNLTVLP